MSEFKSTPKGRLRFREGGWLIVLSAGVTLALLSWGLAPALLRLADRPPGDGQNAASFAFDLSNPRIPIESIEPAMLHRDMIPVLDDPIVLDPASVAKANEGRGKILISSDLVIGAVVEGQARAWPLSILNVHEVINDRIGQTPLAVTWHWPSGASRLFDRRVDGREIQLGVSGLVGQSNQLLYPRNDNAQRGGEPLISQALGRSVTGDPMELSVIQHELVPWSDWLARHPDTTVVAAVPELMQRYKKGKPDTWFASSKLLFSTPPPQSGPRPKAHMLLLRGPDGAVSIVGLDDLVAAASGDGRARIEHDGQVLEVAVTATPRSARIIDPPAGLDTMRILWIAGAALVPEAQLQMAGPIGGF